MIRRKNQELEELIKLLRKASIDNDVKIWKRVADDLDKPSRIRRKVNIYKLSESTKKDDLVVVPGKVLGMGDLKHDIKVAAYSFSDEAYKKINDKGKTMSLKELIKNNPKGKKVRIIG